MTQPDNKRREWILVNLGTPDAPTEQGVRRFLGEFLADPGVVDLPRLVWLPILKIFILRTRPKVVAKAYQEIWTPEGSPLRVQTEAVAQAVRERMDEERWRVHSAYRYGEQNIASVLGPALERADEVYLTDVFPQRTASSSGSVRLEAERVARELGLESKLIFEPIDPADPGMISGWAENVRAARGGHKDEHLLMSFHSIPEAVNERESQGYTKDCEATFGALLRELDWDPSRASLAYQSKFGKARWVQPTTEGALADLGAAGVKRVVLVAPGFLTDGLETLEELGIRGRETFESAGGGELVLVPALATNAGWPAYLAGRLNNF